jgi:hypothetical protein
LLLALLGGCNTTSLTNAWRDPRYAGPPIRKVLVVADSTSPSVRRVFEDEFAASLGTAGIGAVASYTLIEKDGEVDRAALQRAAQAADAQAVFVTRLLLVQQQWDAYAGPYWGPWFGFYGGYPGAWAGVAGPVVSQYDVVFAETSLFSVPGDKLLWSGVTRTIAPENLRRETAGFAKVVIDALHKQSVLSGGG